MVVDKESNIGSDHDEDCVKDQKDNMIKNDNNSRKFNAIKFIVCS